MAVSTSEENSRSDNAAYTGMSSWEQPSSWQTALSRVKGGSLRVWCPNPLIVRLSFRFLGLNGCNEEVKDYANVKETSSRGSLQQERGREPSGRNCVRTVGVSVSHKQGTLVTLSQGLKIFAALLIFHYLTETPALSSKEVAPCRGRCARSQRPSQCATGWQLLGQHSCLRQRSPAPIYYNSGGPRLKGVATDLNRDVRMARKRLAGADTTRDPAGASPSGTGAVRLHPVRVSCLTSCGLRPGGLSSRNFSFLIYKIHIITLSPSDGGA